MRITLGGSGGSGIATYANSGALPSGTIADGTVAVTLDTDSLYVYNLGTTSWKLVANPSDVNVIGTIDTGTPSASGAQIISDTLVMQSASASNPGLVNTTAQTFAGTKTFGTGIILAGSSTGAVSVLTQAAAGTYNFNLPVTAGGAGQALVSQAGGSNAMTWATLTTGTVTGVSVASANGFAGSSSGGATPALTLSTTVTGMIKGNGTTLSAGTAGTDYSAGTSALSTGILKSTTTTGALTIAVAGDFPTLNQDTTGTATNATNIATTSIVTNADFYPVFVPANSTSNQASKTNTNLIYHPSSGLLTTGNLKITGLTVSQVMVTDVTSNVTTIATTGSGNAVLATSPTLVTPALGTPSALIGTNITGTATAFTASNVTTNANLTGDVTSVGNATTLATVPINKGGTGQTAKAPAFDALQPMTTSGDIIYGGTSGTGTRLGPNATATNKYLQTVSSGIPSYAQVAFADLSGTASSSQVTTATFAAPTVQRFTTTGASVGWLFTISTSTTCAVGDTYTNNSNTYTVQVALSAQSGTVLFMSGTGATSGTTLTRSSGAGTASVTFSTKLATALYTTPTSPRTPLYIKIKAAGGGGGGGGSSTTAGNDGGTGGTGATTYLGSFVTLAGGVGGTVGDGIGGAGGAVTLSGVTALLNSAGNPGRAGIETNLTATNDRFAGGDGGNTLFAGSGAGGTSGAAGLVGVLNSGAGGGGGGAPASTSNVRTGSGGGGGGSCEVLLFTPPATIPYIIGTGGGAGSAGSSGFAGGVAADGIAVFEEHYQ